MEGAREMQESFHGADRQVTGSRHRIQCGGKHILIDCGPYRVGREVDEKDREPPGFDAAGIDYVSSP